MVRGEHCLKGIPLILGPNEKEGNTRVTTWAQSPFPDNYLIAGVSTSVIFTERAECASNNLGCAFLTNYNVDTETFGQKWIFTDVQNIREIVFQPDSDAEEISKFALVFDKVSKSNTSTFNTIITFNRWSRKTASLSSVSH